ncbi:hypothetical protein GW17_00057410 [Ensete ventricosum]|nr:hypothetical protein GW17_00057410 [Ensete ventricosum]
MGRRDTLAEVREDRSGFLNLILGFFDEPVGGGRVKNLFSEVRRDMALILHHDHAVAFSEYLVIGGVALLVIAGLGFVNGLSHGDASAIPSVFLASPHFPDHPYPLFFVRPRSMPSYGRLALPPPPPRAGPSSGAEDEGHRSRPGPTWFLPFRRRPGILPPPASVLNNLRHWPWRPRRILDPGGDAVLRWNRIFLVSCLVALFVDPLYFYLLYIGGPACVRIDVNIGIIVTFFRTVADLFYLGHMLLKFWIAFVAPAPGSSAGASLSRTRIRLLCGT